MIRRRWNQLHVDFYFIAFTLEEYYGVNIEYQMLEHVITGMIIYTPYNNHLIGPINCQLMPPHWPSNGFLH